MSAIALSYLPLVFIIPAVINDPAATIKLPYILIFIILFIYSVPFFAIYLEICSLVSFFLEKREYGKFEKTLKLIGAVLTLGAAVAVFFINKFPAVCFTLAGAVGVLLTVELIYRLRSKKAFSSLKRKQTWVFALILTVVVSGIFFAVNTAENAEAKPDPVAPAVCIQQYRGIAAFDKK
jgi:hypothetical protein